MLETQMPNILTNLPKMRLNKTPFCTIFGWGESLYFKFTFKLYIFGVEIVQRPKISNNSVIVLTGEKYLSAAAFKAHKISDNTTNLKVR